MPESFDKEYAEVEDFLIEQLSKIRRGGLREWCKRHNFPLPEISRFKNRNLKTTRPYFMKRMLEAFGYEDVEITTTTVFNFRNHKPFLNTQQHRDRQINHIQKG